MSTTKLRKPRDTSNDLPGAAALFLGGTGVIEQQEAEGQREAVASESLPSEIHDREKWETLGFVFGEPFDDDPLFLPATLPAGWSKQPTDHRMHVALVDAAGNERGTFFYKAAFYDRKASMGPPLTRYQIEKDYDRIEAADYKSCAHRVIDVVTDKAIFKSSERMYPDGAPWYERALVSHASLTEARDWLAERHPDYEDPAAYWPTGDE